MKHRFLFGAMTMLAAAGSILAQVEPYNNPDLSADERALDLLQRMTLEEKINQNEPCCSNKKLMVKLLRQKYNLEIEKLV